MKPKQVIERLKQVKDNTIKLSTYAEIQEPEDSTIQILQEQIQALDYAIEQMENDNLLERLENGRCVKHCNNKVIAYNREWLFIHLEREFELQKAERDILEELRNKNLSDDELAERLSKGLEPYVRSDKE